MGAEMDTPRPVESRVLRGGRDQERPEPPRACLLIFLLPISYQSQDLVDFLGDMGGEDLDAILGHQNRVLDSDMEILLRDVNDGLHRDDHSGPER